jgi:IMP dehydrogenase
MDYRNILALTYDDIQLVPSFSNIKSRKDIKLNTKLSRRYGLLNPLIASPMDTVCEVGMAYKMAIYGGAGIIHRFMSIEEQCRQVDLLVTKLSNNNTYRDWKSNGVLDIPIVAAIGVGNEQYLRAVKLVESGANVLLIDVAHGHHQNVIDMIQSCKRNLPKHVDIVAGSIATKEAAYDLQNAGADALRINIGNGCFTPNMKVKTVDGLKSISDIQIGDMVYTHTGEVKPVYHKFEYDNHTELIDINGIETTPDHKFYVVHTSKADLVTEETIHDYAEWIKAKDLTDDYFLVEL